MCQRRFFMVQIVVAVRAVLNMWYDSLLCIRESKTQILTGARETLKNNAPKLFSVVWEPKARGRSEALCRFSSTGIFALPVGILAYRATWHYLCPGNMMQPGNIVFLHTMWRALDHIQSRNSDRDIIISTNHLAVHILIYWSVSVSFM